MFSQKFHNFSESVHRFLGRPSLLVEFVRNHGVHFRILTGHRCDCMVCTLCIICNLRFRWRSHQSTNLYFAASSSLRQVDLCTYSTQVSFGRRLTPTISLNILSCWFAGVSLYPPTSFNRMTRREPQVLQWIQTVSNVDGDDTFDHTMQPYAS